MSSSRPRTRSRIIAITSATSPVGLVQKTKSSAAKTTAVTRRAIRYRYTQVPTGPAEMPARYPVPRMAANPDLNAPLVRTAITEGR
jgi:hypothetical protein